MNYGYSEKDQKITLEKKDESNRYSIQLYHQLAASTEIENKDIIEIGCGRGGGLSYITKNFHPATATGVDLDKLAISFSNNHYSMEGLSFVHGDAQNLSLENKSADVLFNVESSHRYPDMNAFLGEVYRILRNDGYFLFTDFRYDYEMEELEKDLASCGMNIISQKIINQEVVAALTQDDERKRKLIKKLAPKFLHKIALNFAGTIGSKTYQQFDSGKYVYFSYVLKKV